MGAGTLKDLALVLFVGMLAGAYSSICIATPILADLQERQEKYRTLAKRVQAKATSAKRRAKVAEPVDDGGDEVQDMVPGDEDTEETTSVGAGIRLVQQGPRQQPRRPGAKGRPSGKKKR
jgi:preprotein translocase subunit SecF